jgi:ectoine hydroxylase-related dioxygenase (phytanoyl-CoA dioxygenase family)
VGHGTVASIGEALELLGASEDELSPAEVRSLDEQGFVVFPSLLADSVVEGLRRRFEELVASEGARAGKEVDTKEVGVRRLADLVNKGEVFAVCYSHPKVLSAIAHVFGRREFKLSSLNGRDAAPGTGAQPLHEDWNDYKQDGSFREAGDPFYVVNSLWMLDEFSADNGATRVVPGTHRMRAPRFHLPSPLAEHPEEVKVTGPPGTVVVFNSHLWHGGTNNTSGRVRRALHSYFVVRDFEQQLDQRAYVTRETYERLSPAQRYLLDVEGAYAAP